ncbi:hypothetical protein CI1B_25690 [Bradyrhizobium ivorense]|uniref:Uncharacterized protein n=1 Tax=Bradyrhizobium ivorense TaxID=2511166 RepID=A0A508T1I8_9BRAD|nr:hypothetical protein CI1B_25690 [Bradyrhizobium ivorense]
MDRPAYCASPIRFVKSAQGAYSREMPITRKSLEIRRLPPAEPLLSAAVRLRGPNGHACILAPMLTRIPDRAQAGRGAPAVAHERATPRVPPAAFSGAQFLAQRLTSPQSAEFPDRGRRPRLGDRKPSGPSARQPAVDEERGLLAPSSPEWTPRTSWSGSAARLVSGIGGIIGGVGASSTLLRDTRTTSRVERAASSRTPPRDGDTLPGHQLCSTRTCRTPA